MKFCKRPTLKAGVLCCATSLLLLACGGGGGGGGALPATPALVSSVPTPTALASGYPNSPVTCSTSDQRAWLRDYMDDRYFWHDRQGVPNAAAASMDDYLSSLLFKPVDRYSFAESTAAATQFFEEGTRTGYGYALGWSDTAQTVLKVRLIEPLGPLGLGRLLQRGDTIVSIDGFSPAQIVAGQAGAVTTEGVSRAFVVKDDAGTQRSFSVASVKFALSPVISAQVLTALNGERAGYLMYQEFISAGAPALGVAFDRFRAAGVKHLILDFRYNGGGSTAQARNIASMAGGAEVLGKVFAQYRFSAKHAAENFSQTFRATGLPALALEGIDKIMVITSASTASASELVINSLRPFKNVITVGSTTFGKPFAFLPISACGITYNAVNLDVANAVGFADYSSGFVPTCAVSDDLTRQFGDPLELRTAAALGYVATGKCPAPSGQVKLAAGSSKAAVDANRLGELGWGETSPRRTRVER